MSSVVQCFDWMPSYEDLPMEIILQVFAYLGHTDRQSAGATCKRWYEALSYPELNTNCYAYFSKVTLSDEMQPLSSFNATARPITSYVLEDVTFGSINQFIDKISTLALDITFDNCELSEKQFWLIIRQLKRLQKLKLTHCSNFFMYGSSLASLPTDDAQVMSNVRSLSLRDNKYITDGILSRIMTPISNLEVFDISGCHIAYHNAIHRRFYPGGVTEHRSDAVLTFMCALEMLRPHVEHLQELDFSNTLIGSTSLTALAALDSEGSTRLKLKRLRLSKCTQLNPEITVFLRTQPDLVLLDLSGTNSINDECIQHIVEDNTRLEWLNIAGCSKLTNASAVALAKLQHLQTLDISHCIGITDTGIMEGIAARHNPTMNELNLSYMNLSSEAVKAIATNLPNLLILNLSNCVHAVTDEVVQCIIEHLPQLTELSLEACVRITDAALTGIDIAKLGLNTAMEEGSQDAFNPQPGLIENVAMSAHFPNTLKISLRSKAEEDIVRDAIRKKAMMKAYELSLVDEHDIDGFSIGTLQGLRKLILKDCNKITDVSLKYGLKLKELQHLSLSKCQQISCLGISALVKQSPAIELLDLNDCYNIDDKAVQAISEHLKRLQSLHVSGCSQLTEHALDSIIVNCKNLRELSICRCRRLYTNIEDRLASLRLRTLNMDNVSYFDNLDMFRKKKHVGY